MKSALILAALLPIALCRIQVTPFGPEVPRIERETFGNAYLTEASARDPLEVAVSYLDNNSPIGSGFAYIIKNHYQTEDNGVTHVYAKQTVNGAEIVNGDANLNIDKFGRVISFHSSFFNGPAPSADSLVRNAGDQLTFSKEVAGDNFISPPEAIAEFAKFLKLEKLNVDELSVMFLNDDDNAFPGSTTEETVVVVSNVPFAEKQSIPMAHRYLIVNEDGRTRLTAVWDIVAEIAGGENWFNAQLDFANGKVHQLVDWVNQASYNVFPIGVNDPAEGSRQLIENPADSQASPRGWHDQADAGRGRGPGGDGKFTSTVGNNVYAQINPNGRSDYENNYRPDAGSKLAFDYPLDLKKEPSEYVDTSVTNLFYWNNIMHDVFYNYGFDEKSGNFQEDNFGRGGRENDAVIANAQDGSGMNNANFATPPDGQKGRMRMYLWNTARPKRDGDLEAGIIIHEYAHGISNRLTGGPLNSNCLGWGESGGMGEGWGDAFGTALRMRPEYTKDKDFGMGDYSAGRGIRPFPYSTSMTTNPHKYSHLKKRGYGGVHAIGSVWATMLYELYWALVEKHGFDSDWYAIKNLKSAGKVAGNIHFMKVVVDGMKLQPCRPNFLDARNAILQADEQSFGGEDVCLIWKAFAKRGLGSDAKAGGVDGFDVPTECK